MKLLGTLLVIAAAAVFFQTHRPAAVPALKIAGAASPVPAIPPAPEKVWTQMMDGRWVEHNRDTTALGSMGLDVRADASRATPAPKPGDWMFTGKHPLDPPARR